MLVMLIKIPDANFLGKLADRNTENLRFTICSKLFRGVTWLSEISCCKRPTMQGDARSLSQAVGLGFSAL